MNAFEKSEAIKASFRKGFQDGSSKMTKRRCYGYDAASDGTLVINPEEAKVVIWIFEQYKAGESFGKIAAGLEWQGIFSPTGKPKWNRETIDKLISNEKYTGRVLLQKTSTLIPMRPLFLMNCLRWRGKRSSAARKIPNQDFP